MTKFTANISENKTLTITVFMHGTCSDDSDYRPDPETYFEGELISALRENVHTEKHLVDEEGVGSAEYHLKPVDSRFYFLRKLFGTLFRKGNDNYFAFEQIGLGYGVEENVDEAVKKIQAIKEKHKDKYSQVRINIAGWSRGAASAIELANALYEKKETRQHEVNILAVDPVPGFSRTNRSNAILNENVKKCFWISAKNEHSFGFSPVYPDVVSSKHTQLLPAVFPGHHATLVGNRGWRFIESKNKLGIVSFPQVGKVIRWLSVKFLTENGTKFKDEDKYFKWSLSADELESNLTQIKTDDQNGEYKKFEQEAYTFRQFSSRFFNSARKVIIGIKNWFNQTFSDIPDLNADLTETKYVNRLHQYLATTSYKDFSFSDCYKQEENLLTSTLKKGKEIEEESIELFKSSNQTTVEKKSGSWNPLFFCCGSRNHDYEHISPTYKK